MTRTTGFQEGVVLLIRPEGTPVMFKSLKSTSTSSILLGVLAVIVGIIAIAWPGVTILALVILFAVYAFMDAGLQAARAFSSRSAGPVFGHLLLALIGLAAGAVALAWPGSTAYVLVITRPPSMAPQAEQITLRREPPRPGLGTPWPDLVGLGVIPRLFGEEDHESARMTGLTAPTLGIARPNLMRAESAFPARGRWVDWPQTRNSGQLGTIVTRRGSDAALTHVLVDVWGPPLHAWAQRYRRTELANMRANLPSRVRGGEGVLESDQTSLHVRTRQRPYGISCFLGRLHKIVPRYRRPGTGLIPGTVDRLASRFDNEGSFAPVCRGCVDSLPAQ